MVEAGTRGERKDFMVRHSIEKNMMVAVEVMTGRRWRCCGVPRKERDIWRLVVDGVGYLVGGDAQRYLEASGC
jgi:hypothetical protein